MREPVDHETIVKASKAPFLTNETDFADGGTDEQWRAFETDEHWRLAEAEGYVRTSNVVREREPQQPKFFKAVVQESVTATRKGLIAVGAPAVTLTFGACGSSHVAAPTMHPSAVVSTVPIQRSKRFIN